jgi:hypothetical protein
VFVCLRCWSSHHLSTGTYLGNHKMFEYELWRQKPEECESQRNSIESTRVRSQFDWVDSWEWVYISRIWRSQVCAGTSTVSRFVFIDFGAVYLRDEQRGLSYGEVYSDDAESIESILSIPTWTCVRFDDIFHISI